MVSLPSLIRSLLAMQSTKRDVPPMSSVTIPYIARKCAHRCLAVEGWTEWKQVRCSSSEGSSTTSRGWEEPAPWSCPGNLHTLTDCSAMWQWLLMGTFNMHRAACLNEGYLWYKEPLPIASLRTVLTFHIYDNDSLEPDRLNSPNGWLLLLDHLQMIKDSLLWDFSQSTKEV